MPNPPPLSLTTYAANADGSITKTATYCSSGYTSTEEFKHSGSWTLQDTYPVTITCSGCGWSGQVTREAYTCTATCTKYYADGWPYETTCGSYDIGGLICPSCGKIWSGSGITGEHVYARKTIEHPCSHGKSSSHYYNQAYGYDGSSSTFKVWPITIVGKNGLTGTVSVSSATANDAAISGKSVTVKVTGVTSGTKLKITNSGTGATVTPTSTSTSYSYTFTMPSKVTTITIELAQVAQSIVASLSSYTVGYGSRPTLAVTGAKTALSHASSNTSVASIDTSGNITLNGLGSTTFTITAVESSDYYSASTTVTLIVVKGNLSTKTAPACSSINYGQLLSASTLSGGSVINESSTEVDGTWSWKTPTTVPNAGKFAFAATYKPVDTAHYNY